VKTNGAAAACATRTLISLSISSVIGSEQCSQRVSTVTKVDSLLRCPCTKGVAIASAAQAA
jgi:hypothetical protein